MLSVGNFNMNKMMCKIKGIEYVLAAAAKTPDVKFWIFGQQEGFT